MGGYLQLARPVNCAMSAAGVSIGGLVAVGSEAWGPASTPLVLAAIAAASFTAGGNALNDLYDRETDAINHPDRPIPSGRVSVRAAGAFVAIAFAAAIILGRLVNYEAFVLVVVNLLLMYEYERRLKARGAPGNVVIASLVGSLFLFGGVAVYGGRADPLVRAVVLAALAFLATLAREIVKDIEDMAGDVDRRTLPQRVGRERAGAVAGGAFVAGVALSVVPWWLAVFGFLYAVVVIVADGMFIYAALYSAADPRRSQRIAKYAMIVALVAFLAGGVP